MVDERTEALNCRNKHINIWISHCTYKNRMFPFPEQAQPLFSICYICALCTHFSSELLRMPRSWRAGMIPHLATWLPIWIP